MPVETSFNYPSDLNASYPTAGDARSEGDDHIRGLKNQQKTTWPGISGPVTLTHTEINNLVKRGPYLITSGTASGVSAVNLTSGIDSTYEEYEFHFHNIIPSSTSTALLARLQVGGGFLSGSGEYDWVRSSQTGTTTTVANGSTTATEFALNAGSLENSTANGGFSGVIRIVNPSNTSSHKHVEWWLSYTTSSTNGNMVLVRGVGKLENTGAVTGLSLLASTGSFSGNYKLYGWVKS